jgi:hypothetical protein
MVEYVDTAVFFCSRFVQDDVEEVVLIEAVSEDEALDVLIRRENGLEGIAWGLSSERCGYLWWFVVRLEGMEKFGVKLIVI